MLPHCAVQAVLLTTLASANGAIGLVPGQNETGALYYKLSSGDLAGKGWSVVGHRSVACATPRCTHHISLIYFDRTA